VTQETIMVGVIIVVVGTLLLITGTLRRPAPQPVRADDRKKR
jgi:hypothetical protein